MKEKFFELIAQNPTWDVGVLLERLNVTWGDLIILLKEHSNTLEWSLHNHFKDCCLPKGAVSHILLSQEITFKYIFEEVNKSGTRKQMKDNWFIVSQGGMDPHAHLPRAFIAKAKTINLKAQLQAKLNYSSKIEQAIDTMFNTLNPVRSMYERASAICLGGPSDLSSTVLRYFNEMEELEKKLDTEFSYKEEHARAIYRTAILNILQQSHAGLALTPLDLHPVYCRCSVRSHDY